MEEQDYLIHYGVLGMKWGVRKARKTGTTYSYKSNSTKKYEKKAKSFSEKAKTNKKYEARAKQVSKFAKNSRKSDANMVKYAKKTSTGKAIAQNLIFSPVFSRNYQQMRANGFSRGKSVATNLLHELGTYMVPFAWGAFAGYHGAYGEQVRNGLRTPGKKKKK